jgi:sigma-B regulation protein RsbU (phosphoserine phosphatase)
VKYLNTGCVGIGMLDEIIALEEGCITFENNHKLLCFTDGVVEFESAGDLDFGLNVVKKCVAQDTDIKTTIASIIQSLDIQRSNTKLFDDITLLGIDFYVS